MSWLLVEGGGTKTWMGLTGERPVAVTGGSTHPGSVDHAVAISRLADLTAKAMAGVPERDRQIELVVAAHGAATTEASATDFATVLSSALARNGIEAPTVITGDILPVLLAAGQDTSLAAIVGTGSEYAGTYRFKKFTHAGGLDYILSDEGGGYDIGVRGLRAVVRAHDGRSEPTSLSAASVDWLGGQPDRDVPTAIFDRIPLTHPRSAVASFAPVVVACGQDGDRVALSILEAAADEILTGLLAVKSALGEPDGSLGVALTGSLVTTTNPFSELVLDRLRTHLPSAVVSMAGPDQFADHLTRVGRFVVDHQSELDDLRQLGPVVIGGVLPAPGNR